MTQGFVKSITCPCGSPMRLIHTEIGTFYGCIRYPDCDHKITAHKKTNEPMGTPAGPELRLLRRDCHVVFDRLWRGHSKHMSRDQAYQYLSGLMGVEDAHIASFDTADCHTFIKRHKGVIARARKRGLQTFAEAEVLIKLATRIYKEE